MVCTYTDYDDFVYWLERNCLRGPDFVSEVKTPSGYTYFCGIPASRFFIVYKSKVRLDYEFDVPQKPKYKVKVRPLKLTLRAMTTAELVDYINK